MHYYQRDLAFVHDRGYGLHADRCAPGLLELLSGVGDPGGGLVLELGCGSGALTRHLLAAGLRVGRARAGEPPIARVEEGWAIITTFAAPAPDRVVRDITTFVPDGTFSWRRGHERHENVLVDTSRIPALLAGARRPRSGRRSGTRSSRPACVR
jgi:hypothetical protein